MDEQTTLEVHLSTEFSQNVPKDFLKYTPDEWANYAFENELEYTINYYKDEKPYCQVAIDSMTIKFNFYDNNILKYNLMIVFSKGEIVNGDFILFDNKQISWYGDLGKTILFYSNKKKNNIFLKEFTKENEKIELIEQFGTADLSKHWFDSPKNYLDYEYLLDYQNLFNQLPSVPA
ncbi:hypothetical protein HHL23_07545 [Chryseobacterium sp. RP-3-3]|uniref:Uncharacterized protein n=1 Tax=Chryseobacterium antibioticum TaxID=2728847 RepID=A0A7Y0AM00_9FLAO|nr:hypothetical protein [Chryseobacterium antibioticum]NML69647.1 hypothetical protein [Chryseobacterium antibioticum]